MRVQMIKCSRWLNAVSWVSVHTEPQFNLQSAVMQWTMCEHAGRQTENEKKENDTFASGKLLL